jgi:hypothetical protein
LVGFWAINDAVSTASSYITLNEIGKLSWIVSRYGFGKGWSLLCQVIIPLLEWQD